MTTWIIEDIGQKCIIGFRNSSGEFEYTAYGSGDGGTIGIEDDDSIQSMMDSLAEEYGLNSTELRQIKDT